MSTETLPPVVRPLAGQGAESIPWQASGQTVLLYNYKLGQLPGTNNSTILSLPSLLVARIVSNFYCQYCYFHFYNDDYSLVFTTSTTTTTVAFSATPSVNCQCVKCDKRHEEVKLAGLPIPVLLLLTGHHRTFR